MRQDKSLDTFLKQAEEFHSDFGRHLTLMQSVIRRLRSEKGDSAEILSYELELTAERVKNRHEELNRHLQKLFGRDTVYDKAEKNENGEYFD